MGFSHFFTPSLLQNISSAIGISQYKEAGYLMQWKECLAAVRICFSFRRNLWILCKRMSFSSGDLHCKWKSWIVLQYSWLENETKFDRVMLILLTFNTLPSGHAEMCDCYPTRCWQVTHFCVFLHDVQHMRFWADLAHLSLQGYRQLDAGCWISSYKQMGPDPLFLEP